MGPVRQNPIQITVRSVHMCVHCNCALLLCTIFHRTDLIIFFLTLQTIIIAPMMSIWGKGRKFLENVSIWVINLSSFIWKQFLKSSSVYESRKVALPILHKLCKMCMWVNIHVIYVKKLISLKHCVRSQITRLKLQKSFCDLEHGASLWI